ncbi:Uncharacterized protein OS=Sorangium cellulosum (strain So ce56) GN=sce5710 PE=4 SV=1 [Gemmataceae bacterium]|nr:Uncharacterized protein OS=Sorangium cellulosum (strain So ce56) GN=sce5710 PE=4 SV=1 [Gemmataceae bacterium]VTT99751.1 Uncharacterized protein OS=Sorangium cellulosum (strain So ce56) GN=sce5710 PE=4 SV=1 [Gemmataceae bacterium]
MTEAEWLKCNDPGMLAYSRVESERKWRLVVCACCRRVWHLLEDERSRRALETSEAVADDKFGVPPLTPIIEAAEKAWYEISRNYEDGAERAAAAAAFYASKMTLYMGDIANGMRAVTEVFPSDRLKAEQQVQVEIIRDIFGNPFRPVTVDPAWRTSTVLALARGIYDERAFDRMPILADALQDAGCDSEDILTHCRGPGPHVRGCWVVDLVLGKE